MAETPTTVSLQFRQCPACLQPLTVCDGRFDPMVEGAELTVWKDAAGVWCSVHTPDCRWHGERLPADAAAQVALG